MQRLMNLTTKNSTGAVYQNISYEYDQAGNITKRTNTDFNTTGTDPKTSTQEYTYDAMNRLKTSQGGYNYELWNNNEKILNTYTNTFTYDTIGNILNKTQVNRGRNLGGTETTLEATTYTYDYEYSPSRPHAVVKAGPKTFDYDLNGNMISMNDTQAGVNRTITWDSENRMTKTVDNANATIYAYDHSGARVYKKGKFGTVLYPNNNYTLRNYDIIGLHIFIGATRIASKLLCSEEVNGTVTKVYKETYYYHADHLGSSSVVTNKSGTFHEHLEYFPYGETWIHEKAAGITDSMPYKFTAKELDPETNLYYFGARYYDARVGRWLSVDPALQESKYFPKPTDFDTRHDYAWYVNNDKNSNLHGMGGIYNSANIDLYMYSHQNPIGFIDPDGLAPGDPFASADQAAADAIQYINPTSIKVNREYGGLIYKNPKTNKYYATNPIQGSPLGVKPYKYSKAPSNTKVVGDYHTHGPYAILDKSGNVIPTHDPKKNDFDCNNFSYSDKFSTSAHVREAKEYAGYLGTPSGIMKVFNPFTWKVNILTKDGKRK